MTTIGIAFLLLVIVVFMFAMMTKKGGGCCGSGDPGVGGGSCCTDEDHGDKHGHHSETGKDKLVDPVCGMTVDSEGNLTSEHQGKRYVFCSEHCQKSFEIDPSKYL